ALADEPHDLAAAEREARVDDRAHGIAAASLVRDLEVANLERAHGAKGSTGQASPRSPMRRSSGTSVRQLSIAWAQRGWNTQPLGKLPGCAGAPGMPCRDRKSVV